MALTNDHDNLRDDELGNFGFLAQFGEETMFQLARLAESYLYVNKKMCAACIRQLLENFLDRVLNDLHRVPETPDWWARKHPHTPYVPTIDNKIDELLDYYNAPGCIDRRKFGRSIFQEKGTNAKFPTMLPCAPYTSPASGRTYTETPTWDYFRIIGNQGSHAKEKSGEGLLQERYLKRALVELEHRMRTYFYATAGGDKIDFHATDFCQRHESNLALSSNFALYPEQDEDGQPLRAVRKSLEHTPASTEQLFFSVVPYRTDDGRWTNRKDRYYLVRRFRTNRAEDDQSFLLQAQCATMQLADYRVSGVAPYSVLTNLHDGEEDYIAAYAFPERPHELSVPVLVQGGLLRTAEDLRCLVQDILTIVCQMMDAHVYHRALSAQSFRWCRKKQRWNDAPGLPFDLYVCDLEVCKLFSEEFHDKPSVYEQYREQAGKAAEGEPSRDWSEPRYAAYVWEEKAKLLCRQILTGLSFDACAEGSMLRAQVLTEDNPLVRAGVATTAELRALLAGIDAADYPMLRAIADVFAAVTADDLDASAAKEVSAHDDACDRTGSAEHPAEL